ncbi:hypothetical protein EV672_101280 [Aquabacterium commune]|uniref:4-amino-4-deoxy-L-arabinose transferase-like glycosyltransferase n=1 Tax=Aquabacterium commune TaxID=70586 RepID=A0A4R6RQG5_9BURK|nr:hypothetical protein [Aquabacterium commune]TDP88136.1 hypothetical protein EV672_101280 [Aquabacterium commune]
MNDRYLILPPSVEGIPDSYIVVRRFLSWVGVGALLFGIVFTLHFSNIEGLYEDDFYYYLVVARNFISGNGTSYFKGVLTNGYQPLWQFLVIAAAYGAEVSGWSPLRVVYVLSAAICLFSVVLVLRENRRLSDEGVLALVFCSGVVYLFLNMGMEVPALFFFSTILMLHVGRGGRSSSVIGFALFGCFLSRIDSMVYWLPMICLLLWGFKKHLMRSLLLLTTLVALYCLANKFFFGLWMPVSGLAKNAPVFSFHAQTFTSFLLSPRPPVFLMWSVLVTPVLFYLLPNKRLIIAVSFFLIFVFYVLHAFRSDYGVWPWYQYNFLLHILVIGLSEGAAGFAKKSGPGMRILLVATFLISVGMVFSKAVDQFKTRKQDSEMMAVGKFVADVALENGIDVLAMGDRAGAVGYATSASVVQLEGLVMDRGFLDRYASHLDLFDVLRKYKVGAYVATSPQPIPGEGCYLVTELVQAGDRAVRTRVCMPVLASHQSPSGLLTVVFRVPVVVQAGE